MEDFLKELGYYILLNKEYVKDIQVEDLEDKNAVSTRPCVTRYGADLVQAGTRKEL